MKKVKFLLQLKDANLRLEEALQESMDNPLAIDGTIQRFEFCFELSWKTLKIYLEEDGILCNSPKSCLKEAYTAQIIFDEAGWLELLEARNLTVHVYDQKMAEKIYSSIKKRHSLFKELIISLEGK